MARLFRGGRCRSNARRPPARLAASRGRSARLFLFLAFAWTARFCLLPACGAGGSGRAPEGDAAARWRFEPLGPDGAHIVWLSPLACDAWLAQSEEGALFAWEAYGSGPAEGTWEPLHPLEEEGEPALLHAVRADRAGVLILDGSGALWRWSPLAPEERPAHCGRIPEETARGAVALIVLDDLEPARPRPRLAEALIVTREGFITRTGQAPARWQASFLARAGDLPPDEPSWRPLVRDAARLPGEADALLALCEWEGLFVSRDGGRSFVPVERGLPQQVSALHVSPWSGRLLAAAPDGIYESRDGARTWSLARGAAGGHGGPEDPIVHLQASTEPLSDELWAVTRRGRLLHAEAGTRGWEGMLPDLPAQVHCVAAARGGLRLATSRGVLARGSGEESWSWSNAGLRQVSVFAILAPETQADPWTLETDLGAYTSGAGRGPWEPAIGLDGYGRLDAAAGGSEAEAWEDAPAGRQPLCRCPGPGGLWLGTEDGLFLSGSPSGWTFAGLEGERILEMAAAPPLPWIFARTPERLYASDDGGSSWEPVPLPAGLRLASLSLDGAGGRLLLGAWRHGLFAAPLPEVRGRAGEPLPIQALPNPFTAAVTLRCALPEASAVAPAGSGGEAAATRGEGGAVTDGAQDASAGAARAPALDATGLAEAQACVYSVHGQLVRRLGAPRRIDGIGGAPFLQWEWDGLDERGLPVANGVYLVTTSLGTQRMIGKLIKLR